jgi:capsular exopolysaccharide synthesis family protein
MSNYTRNKQTKSEEAGINLQEIFQRVKQFWYLFVICPLVFLGLAWAYAKSQVPTYEVKSTILMKDEKSNHGVTATDLIAKELDLGGDKKILTDESKIMTSHTVIEQVVRELKLDRSVFKRATFKKQEIYGATTPIIIENFSLTDTLKAFEGPLSILTEKTFDLTLPDGSTQNGVFGQAFTNAYGTFLINKSTHPTATDDKDLVIVCNGTEKAARDIIKSIEIVLPKKESNMVEPTMLTKSPEKAKDILQKMIDVYNASNLADKREVSENTLAFIEKRLQALTAELSGVEQNVESYKIKEGMTAESQTDITYFFNRLGEYDSEVVKLEVQNSLLTSIEAVLTKPDLNFDLLPTNLELKSTSLQSQIDSYNKLVLERNRLAKVAGDNNPTLKNLSSEIVSVKRAIIGNIGRVKQENGALLAQNKSKNAQFTDKLSKTPRNERELTDIKRQQNIKEGLYLFLLQKQEETTISLAGAITDARVIDRPMISETPTGMKKSVLYIMALGAGLFLSLVFVILQGLVVNTVQSDMDITSKTSMPILARIPFHKTADNLVIGGSHTHISETFRSLRSNLQFVGDNNSASTKAKVLLITSATSGEGKDFITLNLGMSFALANKKTVIVNLDLRKPNLFSNFSFLNKKIGVSRYAVIPDMYPHEVIQPSGMHRDLFYIHNGDVPPNPSELLMSDKITTLLAYLQLNFDYVLINTPPIGLVSDALSLKSFVDITLFVVRSGVTQKSELATVTEYADGRKLPNPVIIFNGVKSKTRSKNHYFAEVQKAQGNSPSTALLRTNEWLKETFS